MIEYKCVNLDIELRQILELQKKNLPEVLDEAAQKREGFVTLRHDFELLQKMNQAHPHIIALDNGKLVAYTLVMLPAFKEQFPVLKPMFDRIDQLDFRGRLFKSAAYFVMGQVCVDEKYRGKGVFKGCYHHMREVMKSTFDFNVTVIVCRNTRSLRAHEKLGFEVIHTYRSGGEEWAVVAWDWA